MNLKIDLYKYCSEGTKIKEGMIAVSENVSLKLITFTPLQTNNNPAIVFIPGWISIIDGWKGVLVEMTKDFTIYYLETREKFSSRINGKVEFSIEAIGKDIVTLIRSLGLHDNDFILFGSSLGATSILDCSKNLPIKPKCLVLIGPNAEFRIPSSNVPFIKIFYTRLYILFKPYIKWYLRNFRLDLKNDYEQYEKYCRVLDFADPLKLKKAALSVRNYSVWNVLDKIDYPCLILGAAKDKFHEPENLKRIVSLLKNSTFIEMNTNKDTHSNNVVWELRKYLSNLNERL